MHTHSCRGVMPASRRLGPLPAAHSQYQPARNLHLAPTPLSPQRTTPPPSPSTLSQALFFSATPAAELSRHLNSVEDQRAARDQLHALGLVAFVANGSILPRASGASDLPMVASAAVPFASPPELRVTLTLPHRGKVDGLGVRRGVTIIVGGGFHGASQASRNRCEATRHTCGSHAFTRMARTPAPAVSSIAALRVA